MKQIMKSFEKLVLEELCLHKQEIIEAAQREFAANVRRQRGAGYGGWEKWQKDCETWRKESYIKVQIRKAIRTQVLKNLLD